jgi:uncharacterized membrane protein YeaQ/YmgE (transglycosylase-associated protein family)
MNFITWLIVGGIAGFIADKLIKNSYGLVGDILIGMAGSFIGGWVFGLFGLEAAGFFGEIIAALVGAVLLLLAINYFKRKK